MKRIQGIRKKKYVAGIVALILGLCLPNMAFASEDAVGVSKNGIIEIYSGLTDQDGNFHRVKNTSGFLISNQDEHAYIVTVCHSISISGEEEKKFYDENKIKKDEQNYDKSVRAVIKGDVSSEMTVEAESETQDFCILSIDSVLNEKSVLRLGSSSQLSTGSEVYTLGFSKDAASNQYAQFDSLEVEIREGRIQDPEAKASETMYLQHSAIIDSGNSGGALLDENGYVVGMNNDAFSDDEAKAYYSIPIDEIKEVLDNYGILYESEERDAALKLLKAEYEKCSRLSQDNSYKSSSLEVLQQAVQSAASVIDENVYDIEKINDAEKVLKEARTKLEKKTPKKRIVIYVLAVILTGLFIRLIWLLVWWRKNKINNKEKIEVKTVSEIREINNEKSGTGFDSLGLQEQRNIDANDMGKSVSVAMENEERTVILSPHAKEFYHKARRAKLIRQKTGQSYPVSKAEYFIGKNPEITDLSVQDNRVVSRKHAVIRWTEEGYVLSDLKSANGTFVNGEKIEEKLLSDGDEVVLADEVFVFREE